MTEAEGSAPSSGSDAGLPGNVTGYVLLIELLAGISKVTYDNGIELGAATVHGPD